MSGSDITEILSFAVCAIRKIIGRVSVVRLLLRNAALALKGGLRREVFLGSEFYGGSLRSNAFREL